MISYSLFAITDLTDGSLIWTTAENPVETSEGYLFTISELAGGTESPKVGDIIMNTTFRYTIVYLGVTTVTANYKLSLQGDSVLSIVELYFCRDISDAPAPPTSHVTLSSETTYGEWNLVCPIYNSAYPYYFTCSEILYQPATGDAYYGWSTVSANNGYTSANGTAADASSEASNAASTAGEAKNEAEGLFWTFSSGSGTEGYIKFATIVVSEAYLNTPITMTLSSRNKVATSITVTFLNSDSSDPDLLYFYTDVSDSYGVPVYIVKSSTSTWDLIAKKSEAYDSLLIIKYNKPSYSSGISVTFKDEFIESYSSDWIEATVATSVSGYTIINGGSIITGSITADLILSSAITTDKIAAGAITAKIVYVSDSSETVYDALTDASSEITGIKSGTTAISGAGIITGTLDADKITTGTLSANLIRAGKLESSEVDSEGNPKYSLDLESGTVNMASANITGGHLRIDTEDSEYDAINLNFYLNTESSSSSITSTASSHFTPLEIGFNDETYMQLSEITSTTIGSSILGPGSLTLSLKLDTVMTGGTTYSYDWTTRYSGGGITCTDNETSESTVILPKSSTFPGRVNVNNDEFYLGGYTSAAGEMTQLLLVSLPTSTSYVSKTVSDLASYRSFCFNVTRAGSNNIMASTMIPSALISDNYDDSHCIWVTDPRDTTYFGQCYFDVTNKRVYVRAATNGNSTATLYGLR